MNTRICQNHIDKKNTYQNLYHFKYDITKKNIWIQYGYTICQV